MKSTALLFHYFKRVRLYNLPEDYPAVPWDNGLPKMHRPTQPKPRRETRWYFRMKSPNGEIIMQSESYTRKAGCLNVARLLQQNGLALKVKMVKEDGK